MNQEWTETKRAVESGLELGDILTDFENDHRIDRCVNRIVRWRDQAVARERKEITAEIESKVDKAHRIQRGDSIIDDHEYIDTCVIYKALQHINSIREDGKEKE